MKTKPILIQIFVLATILLILPAAVQAQFTFTTNTDGSINISGYTGSGGAVVIPATTNGLTVTGIGELAFEGCSSLTSVTISKGVTSIGVDAFYNCGNLTSLMIPNSVTSIGGEVFDNCTSLTSVTIPNSVTNIGVEMFIYCSGLTSVTIPNSVTNIGGAAFYGCSSLTSVIFQGNTPTPTNDTSVFSGDTEANAYYFPSTAGWGVTFDGIPTMPIATTPPALGLSTYGSNPVVIHPSQPGTNFVVEMTTNPASGNWIAVTNAVRFVSVQITNAPANAFFRLKWY